MVLLGPNLVAEIGKQLPEAFVVRPLVELQLSGRAQVDPEGLGIFSTKLFKRCAFLLLADLSVLLFLGLCLQTRPRERASEEAHQHVPNRLQIVPPALLNAFVRIDGGIPGSARETEVRPHGGVPAVMVVLLAEAEVDQVNDVHLVLDAEHKVLRLDVAVQHAHGVEVLDAPEALIRYQYTGGRSEFPPARLEPILQGKAQHLHHETREASLHPIPIKPGKSLRFAI
mmetsp:Transcript_5685/g.10172  ORF Transcript_5685/g.10172 Transcript_5685/m.10172 type:complete len:227 (+) Transcript_5685:234-914(+)